MATIIKLTEKKIGEPFDFNVAPNVDTKIISKTLSERLKIVLSSLVSTQQTAYIKYRFIREGGRFNIWYSWYM